MIATPAYHDEVERLKAQRQKELNSLFYRNEKGEIVPTSSPELHKKRVAGIEEGYTAKLRELMDSGADRHNKAEEVLARPHNPLTWLNDFDMVRADMRARFIQEEMTAAKDANALASAMDAALASGDRAIGWLALRYGAQQWDRLEEDAPLIEPYRQKLEEKTAALKTAVMPPELRRELERAQVDLKDGEQLYHAANWALPENRQATAARWGVQEEYLE